MGSIEGLPADRCFAPACEVVVGLAEVATAEEAPMCREGGGVRCLEDEVTRAVDHTRFAPCRGAPEEEDHVLTMAVDHLDDGIGEGLPSKSLVAGSPAGSDGECGVEEEDTLLSPREEMPIGEAGGVPEVGGNLLLDILKAGRKGNARWDREG